MANNKLLYNAAIAGAAAGLHRRWLVSSNPASYTDIRNQIIIFATAVDSVIPTDLATNQQQANLLQSICEESLSGRWFRSITSVSILPIALSIKALFDTMKPQVIFDITFLSSVSAWLRNDTVGPITNIPDLLNANHSAIGNGEQGSLPIGNADKSITFDGTNWFTWPLIPAINGTRYFGVGAWVKTSQPSVSQIWFSILANGSNTASVNKFAARMNVAHFAPFANGADTSTLNGINATTDSIFMTYEWNSDNPTAATREVYTINGIVLLPSYSGTLPSVLSNPTGNAIIGNAAFQSISFPFFGTLSRNMVNFGYPMLGQTEGLLTSAARNQLKTLEPLP